MFSAKDKEVLDPNRKYLLRLLDIDSLPNGYEFCLRGIEYIKKLDQGLNAKFYFHLDSLRIDVKGLTYEINSLEELLILDEVFLEGVYNFEVKKPFTFIDIGMNVGITSLSVSCNALCQKVIAFEPFELTINKALKNFKLNKSSNKIELNKYGLGYPERTINVEYSEEHKGSVGIHGVATHVDNDKNRQLINLKIVDVKRALANILNNEESFIMKIDCEGAEYEIIDRLDKVDFLKKVNLYLIEWHREGPKELKSIFLANDFKVLSFNDNSSNIGMLYAFK